MRYDLKNLLDQTSMMVKVNKLVQERKTVELKEVRKKRSIKQNAYLHVILSLFGIHFGYTLDESKTLLKRNCDFMVYDKEGVKFLKKTSQMDSKELTTFIEWVRNYSSNEGLYLPSSDEYLKDQINIDKSISSHKQYL